jgi:pimeloyl-ACP methyl ester carboxylesterase
MNELVEPTHSSAQPALERSPLLVNGNAHRSASTGAEGPSGRATCTPEVQFEIGTDGRVQDGGGPGANNGDAWPWSIWARMQTIGQRLSGGRDDAPATDKIGTSRNGCRAALRAAATGDGRDAPADAIVPRSYRARWPSLWACVARWCRPLWDVWFVVALFVLYATPSAGPDSPEPWRVVKAYSWALIWIPFAYRFFTGFLHWVLSLVIMPGSILYMQGPALKLLPKALQETVNDNNTARSKRREELLAVTRGTPVRLTTPDGVELDSVYWAGRGATVDGPTVLRLNGNAEAFELQDDILPLMYATRGINVLLFNYRGVGDSSWGRVCGSSGLGHLMRLWSMPVAAGLQLDAWTAFQFLLDGLKVPADKVCIVGHSMGGAVAAQLLAQHTSLHSALCCSRTFAYMSCIAAELAPLFLGVEPASWKARVLMKVTNGLVIVCGWQHRSAANFRKVKGNKWVEFSLADEIIPVALSLPAALRACQLEQLRSCPGSQGGEDLGVELEDISEGLGEVAGFKCMRLLRLEGFDNHNRLWVDQEEEIHVQLVKEALATADAPRPPAAPPASWPPPTRARYSV